MTSTIELPDVAKLLATIESNLSDENRALIKSNLTRRAFTLGVSVTLMQFYKDPESEQVIGKYMIETLASTLWK